MISRICGLFALVHDINVLCCMVTYGSIGCILEMPKFSTSANFVTSYGVPKHCFLTNRCSLVSSRLKNQGKTGCLFLNNYPNALLLSNGFLKVFLVYRTLRCEFPRAVFGRMKFKTNFEMHPFTLDGKNKSYIIMLLMELILNMKVVALFE